jgi:tRNA(Arg) A34 adenosine deaminase TadA
MDFSSPRRDDLLNSLLSNISVVSRRRFLLSSTAAGAAGVYFGMNQALAREPKSDSKSIPQVTDQDRDYMRQAIQLMCQAGVVDKTGGPFGAVVVRDGKVLAASGNSVVRDNDPSAHAEVNAIRIACRAVGSPNIPGAVLYSSCEPCPMCYATAYWARVSKIFYAASWSDYADLFDDTNIGHDMAKPYPQRTVALQQIMQDDAQKVWQDFRKIPNRVRY